MTGDLELSDETLAPEQSVPAPREGLPDRIAQFMVVERIGAGGMGIVYSAYDPQLDRRVALKLVGSSKSGEAAKIRLLREAQGMARISHPNVVPVFEAGTHEGSVWLAMELVKGGTLTEWLAVPRDWNEIVELFIQAGRGLAAAHTAGLIHRDFKPDNVLIGEDGRPQVADFGLVRPTAFTDAQAEDDRRLDASSHARTPVAVTAAAGDSAPESDSLFEGSVAGLSESITRVGAMLGTPSYMAPEQISGQDVGPHSDQFAFCVALYRALFDQPPFAGRTVMELVTNVVDGKLRRPPGDPPVPRPIVEAVMRGLAHDPSERFASMDDLLDALAPPAPRRWGLWIAGALALTLAGVAVFFALRQAQAVPLCSEGPTRLEGVWDAKRRASVEEGFSALGLVHGPASFEQAAVALDGWAEGWIAQYTDACEATHVRGDQSAAALDLRMTCLDQHRRDADAIVELLENPDAQLVEHAAELVAELPDSSTCERLEELRSITPPTQDQEDAVSVVQEELSTVRALKSSGRRLDAKRRFEAIDPNAASVDHAQTRAQLSYYRAMFDDDLESRGDRAAKAFAEALLANDDALALEIALLGLETDGALDGRRGKIAGQRWFTIADALSERRGRPLKPELALIQSHAWQLDDDAQFEAAIAEGRRAVQLAERGLGPESLAVANAVRVLGGLLSNAGRFNEATQEYRRASLILEKQLGPDHPRLIPVLYQRALVSNAVGDFDEARGDLLRMTELSERVRGPDDRVTVDGLSALGVSYDLSGDHERAREVFEELLARLGERESPKTRTGLETANSLCFVLYKLEEFDEAQALCEATLIGARKGERAVDVIVLNNLALIARAKGEIEVALGHDREALARGQVALGPDHVATSYSLVGIGESLILLGQPAEAIEPLERALELRASIDNAGELAEARCLLATALLGMSAEPERARELLKSSAEGFALAGKDWDERAKMCAELG